MWRELGGRQSWYAGEALRLYFDNNVYNRPFDDLSVPRNREEAQAVEGLFEKVVVGEVELYGSFVLELENSRLSQILRRERVGALISLARSRVERDAALLARAEWLQRGGLRKYDALHLAAAERAEVDYFVTCDDRLLKEARRIGVVETVTPLELFDKEVF